MKISMKWLRELVSTGLSDSAIADGLTAVGLEIEGREQRAIGEGAAQVVAARVVERKPVEGSDHLGVCQVDDGQGVHQVVCGASNYAAGDVVPMARVGAVLPNGMKIGKAKLRGVESFGMLCSARELGLGDDHSGLLQLPKDSPLGTPVEKLLGLPDLVLEVNVTPNRPDALSHLGVAREVAALGGELRVPQPKPREDGQAASALASVRIDDSARCRRYLGRVIEGVKVGPSPLHLQERLRSCGIRPISNVVDATNLVLLELGHPLHAFDLDKLDGHQIIVRRARAGESMVALDGKERKLDADDLVIADADRPVALAGVMGGQTSEVSDGTTRVLLESAVFDASGVRRTSKRHQLKTEASHRFERGTDEATAQLAVDRCAELIAQLAGGTVRPGRLDAWPAPKAPTRIWVRPARVSAVLGTPIDAAEVEKRLTALGLKAVEGGPERRLWEAPPWRGDLTREIDCIEEIARTRGYDSIPIEVHRAGVGETAAPVPDRLASTASRHALSARGYDEVLNYSFVAERDLLALAPPASGAEAVQPIRVANPLTVEQGAMRTSLIAGLLRNAHYNLARGAEDVRLYELGRAYLPQSNAEHPSGPLSWPTFEPRRLALVATGRRSLRHWSLGKAADVTADFYDLKGAVEDVVDALGIKGATFGPASVEAAPWLHPAAAAELRLDGKPVGVLGQVHPQVAAHFEVPPGTLLAELAWDALSHAAVPVRTLHGVPRFPAVGRDLAFLVDDAVPAARLEAEIRAADAQGLLESVLLFDQYKGAPVPAGKKSLAYALRLRAPDRTLTDADADALCAAVVARLQQAVGAEQRA
jgi:phenylalanyl-tRNA synthetase beta chain